MTRSEIFITCHPHIGPFLSKEIKALGFQVLEEGLKGVLTSGSYTDTMVLNLHLRTGNRVLFKIADFSAHSPKDLYEDSLKKIHWESIIPTDGYFSVDSSVSQPGIKDFRFANLKLKDAIVDRIRKQTGKRPDTGPFRDRIVIFLHWYNNRARIYIDTSGETISKHGYRLNPFKAPMIESLAAATIMASGWEPSSASFINPMCGSGTLAIEAALMSLNKPPGLLRNNFGFLHTKWYNPEKWNDVQREAKSNIKDTSKTKIIGTDISPVAIRASEENAKKAGVEKYIDFAVCDFRDTPLPKSDGVVFINPEYGERMGELNALKNTYPDIGDFFKQKCSGKTGFIFTGNLDLAKRVGLRTSRKTIFYNGKIECRLLEYELYDGKKELN